MDHAFCWILQKAVIKSVNIKSFATNVECNCSWLVLQWRLLLAWFDKVMPVKQGICEGLTTTIDIRTKGLITPIVRKCSFNLDDNFICARRYEMKILKCQVGLFALHFGSLGYNRRKPGFVSGNTQWLETHNFYLRKDWSMIPESRS